MFVEKENYFYIEEFEKLGVKAIYTKKNAGNMSDYCPIENQIEGIRKQDQFKKKTEKNYWSSLDLKIRSPLWRFKRILQMFL